MSNSKYYDWTRKVEIHPPNDGCRFEDWGKHYSRLSYTIHPKGFLIFLPSEELHSSDEYREGDPYTADMKTAFHQRRANCTLDLIGKIQSSLGNTPRILDIGCGRGFITSILKQRLPYAEVSALDYSLSAIEFASSHFPVIDFAVADAYKPPYSREYFDIVICNNLWEHVPDPLSLLEAIRKVLKTGGYVIISTPSRYRLRNLIRVLVGKPVVLMSDLHITEYSVGQVNEQLKSKKFSAVETYSEPVDASPSGTKERIARLLIVPFLRFWIKRMGSHHSLESTVFFLAKKERDVIATRD